MRKVIKVEIPDFFEYKDKIINDEEFLLNICKDSVNNPIMNQGNTIGIIQKTVINDTKDGVIHHGVIWLDVDSEFMMELDKKFKFVGVNIELKNMLDF